MTALTAINEQLLRAVGVGIALFDADSLGLRFQNDVFSTWFEGVVPGAALTDVFPQLDLAAMRSALDATQRYSTELRVRKQRRTLVIAQIVTLAQVGDDTLLVLECQNITRIRELEFMIESYSSMVERNTREIQREKEQVEKLLLNIMPRAAYEEYRSSGIVAPQKYESVSVLVLDFVGFAETIERLPPATFVSELNELYSAFDRIGEQFSCERIKTTGDTYLCVAGMHEGADDHTAAVANAAIRFLRYLRRRNDNADTQWRCRIGIASGPVVGSVVGVQKYVYDVFGRAVNAAGAVHALAAEMEALVAADTADLLRSAQGIVLGTPQTSEAEAAGAMALGAE